MNTVILQDQQEQEKKELEQLAIREIRKQYQNRKRQQPLDPSFTILFRRKCWIISRTKDKFGDGRRELLHDYHLLLEKRYGKNYIWINQFAQAEIVKVLKLDLFPPSLQLSIDKLIGIC